ncbi:UNKNOWN [Stylonychia lemnae]|uniref:Ion transport domain-containing protein n=1 Tax=Stylonychia lemnae TaxID=5949 RepID=A0A078AYR1_STYLE|nr:UNKNOWN [Stylonychia lemnae]|eukprot:CDW87575.1 UNKNOWN [Stylonychia lemnae]
MKQDQIISILSQKQALFGYLKQIPGYGNCINLFQDNIAILEAIAKTLNIMDKNEMPILISKKLLDDDFSPLYVNLKSSQIKIVNLILTVILKYQNQLIFNELVDKNLSQLIDLKIDLQDYFQSHLPLYQIFDDQYPQIHESDLEIIEGINLDNPVDVHSNYDMLFGQKLSEGKDVSQIMVAIEYFMINLPDSLASNQLELIKTLSNSDSSDYFESEVLQTIIKFKWQRYTKSFYQFQFMVYLLFMISFIIEIYHSTFKGKTQIDPEDGSDAIDDRKSYLIIINKVVSASTLFFFLTYELRQILIQKKQYFLVIWNIIDITQIIAYITLNIIEFQSMNMDSLVLLFVIVIALSFLKLYYFLRIYEGFSFLVQMITKVFQDLKFFIAFFLIFIVQFGLIFTVLFKAAPIDEYEGVNAFGYYLMIFRISAGDFSTDNYKDQSQYLVIITWIVWIIAVISLNIIFMNFIIAVISESYEKVMQKIVAESYKVKTQMIREREQFFRSTDLVNDKYFPKYLVIRRQVNQESQENGKQHILIIFIEQENGKDLLKKQRIQQELQQLEQRMIQCKAKQFSRIS